MRTCILPPPRTTGTYAGTAPSIDARHCSTMARCASIERYPGRWKAPGAISMTVRYHWRAVRALRSVVVIFAVLLVPRTTLAHPVPFSYLDLRLQPAAIDGTLVAHIFDVAHDLHVEPADRLLDPAFVSQRAGAIVALLSPRLMLSVDGQPLRPEWSNVEVLAD